MPGPKTLLNDYFNMTWQIFLMIRSRYDPESSCDLVWDFWISLLYLSVAKLTVAWLASGRINPLAKGLAFACKLTPESALLSFYRWSLSFHTFSYHMTGISRCTSKVTVKQALIGEMVTLCNLPRISFDGEVIWFWYYPHFLCQAGLRWAGLQQSAGSMNTGYFRDHFFLFAIE